MDAVSDDADDPDEPEDKPALPKAIQPVSRAVQIAVAAGAIVVLLVVALVLVLVGSGSDKTRPGAGPTPTEVPSAPPSTFEPSRTEPLPTLPNIPSSLCPSAPLTQPITVLSFNIHSGQTARQRTDLERVGAEIKAWQPDVVLLQEVDDHRRGTGSTRQAEVLGGLTDLSWVYGGNQQRPDGGPIGNAILSKFPVKAWKNTLLPQAGGKQRRGLLHAVLDVKGTEISVYSTHFAHRSAGARLAQARAAVRTMAADPRPKIIGGDLNTTANAAPLVALRAAGLGDVWAVGQGNGFTVPAARPRARIDFILHDGWFEPIQSAVLASSVSDHRAVWTRLEFREELSCFKVGGS